jgi:hypothetical protein
MISCRQARHLFDAFLDDELSPAMRTELHTHRLSCPDCSRELALLEACADVVRTDGRGPVLHGDFSDRVMVAFTGRPPVPTHRWRRIAVFAGSPLVAAAVLVFAFTTWYHPMPTRITLSYREHVAKPLLEDLERRGAKPMTAEEKAEIEKGREIPTNLVLEAWLRPAVERANHTLTQTQQSVSQLANFVRLGILPPEMLQVAGLNNKQPATDKKNPTPSDELIGPQFDSGQPADEHLGQPESTDTTTDSIEVM